MGGERRAGDILIDWSPALGRHQSRPKEKGKRERGGELEVGIAVRTESGRGRAGETVVQTRPK